MRNLRDKPFVVVDLGSGSFARDNEGHEKYNEKRNEITRTYLGYAPDKDNLNIAELGANKSDAFADDILVIYTSRLENSSDRFISSYLPSAKVYSSPQSGKGLHRSVKKSGGYEDATYCIESDTLIRTGDTSQSAKFVIRVKDWNVYMFRKQRFYKGTYPNLDELILDYLQSLSSETTEQDDVRFQESLQSELNVSEQKVVCNADTEPEYSEGATGRQVKEKAGVSKAALYKAGYVCEVDASHGTFENRVGNPYMEGHHLIPCTPSNATKFWEKYGVNIDCVENICCICPTCHRQIHYGSLNARDAILKALYNLRHNGLKNIGLPISESDLLKLYE